MASLRRRVTRLAAALLAVAVVASGCSPAINLAPETGHNAAIGTTSDINPQDPATLQNGGDLRLALSHNVLEYHQALLAGTPVEVEEALFAYVVERSKSQYPTEQSWLEHLVWCHGKDKRGYLYPASAPLPILAA